MPIPNALDATIILAEPSLNFYNCFVSSGGIRILLAFAIDSLDMIIPCTGMK